MTSSLIWAVVAHPWGDDRRLRAPSERLPHRHRGADPERPGLVRRCAHHPPPARASHDQRASAERWIVSLLDRR